LEVLAIQKARGSVSFLARAAPTDVQTSESGDGGAVAFNLALTPTFFAGRLWTLARDPLALPGCCREQVAALFGGCSVACRVVDRVWSGRTFCGVRKLAGRARQGDGGST